MSADSRRTFLPWSQLPGVRIMLGYAVAWAAVGGFGLFGLGLGLLAALVVALVVSSAVALLARAFGRSPRPVRRRRPEPMRDYFWINMGQTLLIVVAVVALISTGTIVLLPAVICLVVGLHFLPLARTFGQPQYWATGVGMCLLAIAALVVVGVVGATLPVTAGLVGVGSAVVLWGTALAVGLQG